MKRSHFLKSLLALPFIPKVLGAEEAKPSRRIPPGMAFTPDPYSPAESTTYFVDLNNGSDASDGMSPDSPLLTTEEACFRAGAWKEIVILT